NEHQTADKLITHNADGGSVGGSEYEVHGTILATGAKYDNRFCSSSKLKIARSRTGETTWIHSRPGTDCRRALDRKSVVVSATCGPIHSPCTGTSSVRLRHRDAASRTVLVHEIDLSITMKTRVELPGMGPLAVGPLPLDGGITKLRDSPTCMPAVPATKP